MECLTCKKYYSHREGDYTYAAWCNDCEKLERRHDTIVAVIALPAGVLVAHLIAYIANM
jgi:hypothetical protein